MHTEEGNFCIYKAVYIELLPKKWGGHAPPSQKVGGRLPPLPPLFLPLCIVHMAFSVHSALWVHKIECLIVHYSYTHPLYIENSVYSLMHC